VEYGFAQLIAIITGVGGVIAAVSGVLLAVRAARNRERKACKEEVDTLARMLADERDLRIRSERHTYRLALELAEHGLKPPPDDERPIPGS
jgi:hypothetical protein